jgi:hypothetical protein
MSLRPGCFLAFSARSAAPLLLLALGATPAAGQAISGAEDSIARRAAVAERGSQVMPFDLSRTRHDFRPLEDGGLQTVVARDTTDAAQVTLIRQHLSEEAERFRRGDFTDPAFVHGSDMPGVAELTEGADRLHIEYAEIPFGGRIHYTSADPALVDAIHRWFRAQTSDHGAHARP